MADLSLDDIIATRQGMNTKEQPMNQNAHKQFQGKPLQQKPFKRGFQQKAFKPGFQQKPFKPGFVTKGNRPGGAPLKRAFSAPGPVAKTANSNNPRGARTPNQGANLGGPGRGQIDARDMITIKNRIKMGDARMKILQKRMNKGNMGVQAPQPQIPPAAGPHSLGPGSQQQFTPQQQPGFQRPFRPPGPQRFQQPNQQGGLLQHPRPLMEQQGPPMNQQRPPLQQQRPPFNQQLRPPFNQHQRPPFIQHQRPPFSQQHGPFNQGQRPPFHQQQRPPFNQQQRPPFSQQQGLPFNQQQPPFNQHPQQFDQQPPEFNQQPPEFNQQPPEFNQQPPEFNQQPPEFDQQPPDFVHEQFSQEPPQFNQEQMPSFGPDQPLQFNPDPQFDQQSGQFNPEGPLEQPQQFGQEGPGPQFNQQAPQFGQPPPQMNQLPPNFMQSPPGPNQPPTFNQPPPDQGFNSPPNLSQPLPEFVQPPPDMSQPPPGFGQLPPEFNEPPPGFQSVGDEEGVYVGFMPANPIEKTVVEDTGTSLKITRTIPEVSFDGANLTVTRRLPAANKDQEAQKPLMNYGLGTNKLSAGRPALEQPKKKFQPTPIKAPSPPRNTVKTGGPTLSGNRIRVSPAGQNPVNTQSAIQPQNIKENLGTPVPSSSVETVSNTLIRTAKTEAAPSSGPITRTVNNAPQQPSRFKPPPQPLTGVTAPSERPSAFSRIQLPNQNTGSVFSRMQQQPQNTRSALSRVQHPVQGSSVLSRLSAPTPSVPVTKRLAPPPAAPPQPARMQVSLGSRMAVKRPALSLSERFSSGGSGNPIPVITDHALAKKRRPSEPEPEKADVGNDFPVEEQFPSQEEPGVPLLSPLQGFRVLVSNLHSTVTQDDVIELFGALGPLKRANLLANGQSEVAFIHKEHALLAMKTYHNRELDGQPMFLKLTTPMNAKVMQPPAGEDSPPVSLPAALRTKKPPAPSSAPVEIPLIHKALFKTSTDGTAPSKAVRFTVKL